MIARVATLVGLVLGLVGAPAALALPPSVELLRANLRWQPGNEDFVEGYVLNLRYRLCDPDSFGDVDVGDGPATEELLFERRTGTGVLLSRARQRSPIGIDTGCLTWQTGLVVPERVTRVRPGKRAFLHVKLRVRDPEGSWSNTVGRRFILREH
jgi:hypothetical protein